MPLSQNDLDDVFKTLEVVALAGGRCPTNDQFPSGATSALAKAGHIRIEVYALNWRVITILTGPHTGMRTAKCPHRNSGPYLTIEAARAEPSAPRPLTSQDLKYR